MEPLLILYGGAALSAIVGLLGIAIIRRDTTPIVELLSPDEQKSYWTQRLVTEGITQCTICKQPFRVMPDESERVCLVCMPPDRVQIAVAKADPQKRQLNFGKAYTPLHVRWPDLFENTNDVDN